MNNNLKIVLIVCATILVITFSYFLFFSPMARCVNELNSFNGGASKGFNNDFICANKLGKG